MLPLGGVDLVSRVADELIKFGKNLREVVFQDFILFVGV